MFAVALHVRAWVEILDIDKSLHNPDKSPSM